MLLGVLVEISVFLVYSCLVLFLHGLIVLNDWLVWRGTWCDSDNNPSCSVWILKPRKIVCASSNGHFRNCFARPLITCMCRSHSPSLVQLEHLSLKISAKAGQLVRNPSSFLTKPGSLFILPPNVPPSHWAKHFVTPGLRAKRSIKRKHQLRMFLQEILVVVVMVFVDSENSFQ